MPDKPERNVFIDLCSFLTNMPLFERGGFNFQRMPLSLLPHTHKGFEITYVQVGEVTWVVEGEKQLHLTGGDMAITGPGVSHHGEYNIIRPCKLLWFILDFSRRGASKSLPFSPQQFSAMHDIFKKAADTVARPAASMSGLFESLHAAIKQKKSGEEAIMQVAWVQAYMAIILLHACDAFSAREPRRSAAAILRARQFMISRLDTPPSIAEIARIAGMSPSWFYERFVKEVGQTPADYLLRLRCDRAARLLVQSGQSITAVALDLGFSSSQYFSTCFRKFTGMTPTDFRKQHRGAIR